jgi:diguanylate cyclase (GGDEF)-like protein/PAS domain S-box-containing protein
MDLDVKRLLELSRDLYMIVDGNGRLLYLNQAMQRWVGGTGEPGTQMRFGDLVHPDDRGATEKALNTALTEQSSITRETRMAGTNGEYQRLEWTLHPDHQASVIYAIAQEPAATSGTEEFLRTAIEASPCAMIVVDEQGALQMVNQQAERLFGYERGELLGRPVEILIPEDLRVDHAKHREQFRAAPSARAMGRGRDLVGRRHDGTSVPVEIGLTSVSTPLGRFALATVVDLTAREATERQLALQAQELVHANAELVEMASTDSLTSLWNRRTFMDQLTVHMELSLRNERPLSVLLLDIDHFKPYNDTFGHLAGDAVLKQLAEVLRENARRSDYQARLGGEEFGIILPETDGHGAVRIGERFRTAIEKAHWSLRPITASFGAMTVHCQRGAPRPDPPWHSMILLEADKALYFSKEHGRNRVTHADDLAAAN